jgi:hypothetical protein
MTARSQLLPDLLGRLPGLTAIGQMNDGLGQTAASRKPDGFAEPKTFVVEPGDVLEGIPLAVVRKTAEVADFGQETTDRRDRILSCSG